MNNNGQAAPAAGISLGDIYYTIFRHKWKIVAMSLMGFVAAAAIYHVKAPLYQSQAELLIKYVPESTEGLVGDDQHVIVPNSDGGEVINSEIRILTSLDVAEDAASNIGPANVLPKLGAKATVAQAAGFIRGNLVAEPADGRSSVIVVTLEHPDPQIVQQLLGAVITSYQQKHYEIHSAGGQTEDALTMEQSTLSVQLNATEQQLADLKNKYGIISLDDAQKDLAAQLAKAHAEILDAQAELSGDEAAMKEATGTGPVPEVQAGNRPLSIPPEKLDAYTYACASLDTFRKQEQEYMEQGYTQSNILLQAVEEEIASNEKQKMDLEKQYPGIAGVAPVAISASSTTVAATNGQVGIVQIAALKAKIQAWQSELKTLETQATNLNNLAPTITQLQQTEAIQEANLHNLSTSLEQANVNAALDTGKTPNIRSVQAPSPPSRDWKKTHKMMGLAIFGGVAGGIGWAFLIELVLDRSVRRPAEVERKLKLPLFISIPDVKRNGYARLAGTAGQRQLLNGGGTASDSGKAAVANGGGSVAPVEQNSSLQPFHQALRDRLLVYFEVKGFTHKPKLVAVTGASHGAGVSSVASGLAASLSETGDGNVLLVDMHLENGAAQQFYKGKPCCGLDTVLASEKKKDALVQQNLYVVNGNADQDGLSQALPKRFTTLVPKLKASEYDYIIFDMPVISPTSVTSHLARFMDITLLVVESEKTGRDIVEHANAWLMEVGATVGVVLNKTHQYVPKQLHQEFLGGK
ncbi:MAG TPA: Wzz/FepE/Etk N-terminal domain-containing protein [Candidatus Sulfotelmatobacter sp.]|nr:Wzz/FepE/Etk N-terminal domain-containing protein [Candidatus Sulfotelmatobacter sp.]